MKEIKYEINYGGFIGATEEVELLVEDDATEEEIDDLIRDDFEEHIRDNCYWERID